MSRFFDHSRVACLVCAILCISPLTMYANDNTVTGAKAKELFTKVYNMVYGPQGCTLRYKVNIIGLYKTQGLVVYKGKKTYYNENRYKAWEDGTTSYMVDSKKKTVDIYRFDDDRKYTYLSKFKYNISDFDFSYTEDKNCYFLTAKVRDTKFLGVKSVTAKIDKNTLSPMSLTIKLAILRTTVQISDFHSGEISSSTFVFPKEKFRDYQFIDHRSEK